RKSRRVIRRFIPRCFSSTRRLYRNSSCYDAFVEIITQEEIDQVRKEFESFTESDIRKMMKVYQRKQTALLVYTAAVAEREELNEEEYDVLISATMLIWETMRRKFPDLRKVRIERMEELDNLLFQELESLLHKSEQEQEKIVSHTIRSHLQPVLLGTV